MSTCLPGQGVVVSDGLTVFDVGGVEASSSVQRLATENQLCLTVMKRSCKPRLDSQPHKSNPGWIHSRYLEKRNFVYIGRSREDCAGSAMMFYAIQP